MIELNIKFDDTVKVFEQVNTDERIIDAGVRFKVTQAWVESLNSKTVDGANGEFVTYKVGHSNTSVQLSSELAELGSLEDLVGQQLYLRASYTKDPSARRVKGWMNWKLTSYKPEKLLDSQEEAIKYAKEHGVERAKEESSDDPLKLLRAAMANMAKATKK